MHVLIIGAAGMIGRKLTERLAREGKLNGEAGSVRDLVMRQQPSIDQH